jgi:hypothetical protein
MSSTNNSGTMDLVDGQTLTVTGNLNNSGVIELDPVSPDSGGSSLNVTGTLINGGTLTIGNAGITAADTVTIGNLINTGSIAIQGSGPSAEATLNVAAAAPNMLTGSISLSGYSVLNYAGGGIRSIAGTASLTLDGPNAQLSVIGGEGNETALATLTVNGGTLTLDDGAVFDVDSFNNIGTLTLDGAVTTTGGTSFGVADMLLNSGTLAIGHAGIATPDTVTVGGEMFNTGSVAVDGGGLSVASVLVNGGSLTIGPSSTVTVGSLLGGGSISLQGSSSAAEAVLNIDTGAPIILAGSVSLSGFAQLTYAGGGITAIGTGASLTLDGSNAQISVVGGSGNDSALAVLTVNGGSFFLQDAAIFSATGSFNNIGTLGLDSGISVGGGSDFSVAAMLLNSGAIVIGNAGGGGGDRVTVGGDFLSTGSVSLAGGGGLSVGATFYTAGSLTVGAPATVTVGGSLINAGSIVLRDTDASAPAALTVSGSANNAGSIMVGSGAAVTISGFLINNGAVATAGGDFTVGTDLFGTGSATIAGGSLTLGQYVDAGETIGFEGPGDLVLGQAGAVNGTISGFVAGDTIDLEGLAAMSAHITAGNTLIITGAANVAQAALRMGGSFVGDAFVIVSDGHGGSDISVAPAVVSSGQTLVVSSGITIDGVTVLSGGEIVYAGGAVGGAIFPGGIEGIGSGATASGLNIASGVSLIVSSGGTAFATVRPGGAASVESGGLLTAASGNSVASATVLSGGEFVYAGGTVGGLTVSSGGTVGIASGATVSDLLIYNETIFVSSGGTAVSPQVVYGGVIVVESGGTVTNPTINTGGVEILMSGVSQTLLAGTDSLSEPNVVIQGGAELTVSGPVSAQLRTFPNVEATVSSGGQVIYAGVVYGNSHISSGGHATILSGAEVVDLGGGEGSVITVSSGGLLSAIGSVAGFGGQLTVSSGGTVSTETLADGAAEIVSAGGTTSGAITFLHSSVAPAAADAITLTDGNTSGIALPIAGFANVDKLDLSAFEFSGAETLSVFQDSGDTFSQLTITDGALHATVTLFGQYAAAGFNLASDGVNGTAITYGMSGGTPLDLVGARQTT